MIVAAISNKLACPVVTNDSDFYILNINAGVITIRSMTKLIGKNPFVMLYHIKNLSQYLDLKLDYLKFLPVVLGNDYSDENNLEKLQKNCGLRNKNGTLLEVSQRITYLSSYLKTLKEEENIITGLTKGSTELRREIYKVLKEFNLDEVSKNCSKLFSLLVSGLSQEQHLRKVSNNSNATIAETLCLCCNIGLIDPCVVDIYFSNMNVTSVQVEKLCSKTSEHVSTQIRWLLYAILHFKAQTLNEVVVTEYRRVGLEYKSKVLHLDLKEWDEIYHLDLQKLKIEPEDLFCKLTGFDAANLSLFRDSSLFLLSIHYCVSHIHEVKMKLPYKLVAALILTFLLLQNGSTMTFETKKDINLDIAHICSSWQSVLFYLNILNALLGFPFPMLKMSKTFDGQKMYYLFKELTEGKGVFCKVCRPSFFLHL